MRTKDYIPERWVEMIELHPETTFLALDKVSEYGFTGVTLWSSFMIGLDDYYYTLPVVYRNYPEFNKERDLKRIDGARKFLREFARRAHKKNLKLLHAYHICNLVTGPGLPRGIRVSSVRNVLRKYHPEWLTPEGEPDMSRDYFYDFMRDELDQFFEDFPEVDGIFCFNCECSVFTPSRLYHQKIPLQQIVRRAVETVQQVCRKHNKIMTHDIHSGGAHQEMSRAVINACSKFPEIILGADCTYSDWQFFLDTTPFLSEMSKNNRIYVSFDAAGEFFGKGEMLGPWINWIEKHFKNAKKYRPYAISCRSAVNDPSTSAFVNPLTEMNLVAVGILGKYGNINIEKELEKWWNTHFSGKWDSRFIKVINLMEQAIGKILYLNGAQMTNLAGADPNIWVDKEKNKVWFWEQWAEPGTPINLPMTPECGSKTKPVNQIKEEKKQGIELCRECIEIIEKMHLPDDTHRFFKERLQQAIDVADTFIDVIDAAYALYQIKFNHYDKKLKNPEKVLSRAKKAIYKHAEGIERRWGSTFFTGFPEAMRKLADSIP